MNKKRSVYRYIAACMGMVSAVAVDLAVGFSGLDCQAAPTESRQKMPGLVLWVKAGDLQSLLKDGARVSVWPDASGLHNDLRGEGDSCPTLKLDGIGGLPSVVFVNQPKATPPVTNSLSMPFVGEWRGITLFVAGRKLDSPGLFESAQGREGDLRAIGFVQMCGTKASVGRGFPDLRGKTTSAVATIRAQVDEAGVASLATFANGTLQGSGTDPNSLYGIYFAKGKATLGGSGTFNGEIFEVLIYDGALPEAEQQAVERYLMVKYGIAEKKADDLTLPFGYVPPAPIPSPPPVKSQPATKGLLVWARADDLTGLDEGAAIETWPNVAGSKAPLTTATIANRPKFIPHAMNNRPVVRFEGNGKVNPKIVQYFTLPVKGDYPEMTFVVAGANLSRAGIFDSAPGRDGCLRAMGGLQLCGSKLAIGRPFPLFGHQRGAQMMTLVAGRAGAQGQYLETFANGHAQQRVESPDTLKPVLFAQPAIGCNNRGETQFSGDMAEVLLYDHALTPEERQQTDAYLSEKYAIPIKSEAQLELEKNAFSRWSLKQPHLPASKSWLGNSFSGKDEWVQSGISGITVLPDGTVAATSIWDERHKEIGFYKDGKPVGPVTPGGASQIVFDDTYFYVGNSGMGKPTAGVRRYLRDGSFIGAAAPWPELGAAKWISFDTSDKWKEVDGLVLAGDELLVTAADLTEIRVYQAATGAFKRSLPVEQSGRLVAGKDGTLWLGNEQGVTQLTLDGKPTGKAISGVNVGALAFDPKGNLLVGDKGERHQVIYFDVSGPQPREIRTLGERGGVYAGPRRGAMGDNRLWNIMGLGVDADGNVAVECMGSFMRSYSPEGTLRWQLECTVFCICSDFDPATDGNDIYSHAFHYRYVPGAPPGRDWIVAGVTSDPARFPEVGTKTVNVLMRRLKNGQLYRFGWTDALSISRQEPDSEIFIPCGYYVRENMGPTRKPKELTEKKRCFWSDTNGDGRLEEAELSVAPSTSPQNRQSYHFYVDDNGGIWEPQNRWGLRHIPLKGFAASGAPIYDLAEEVLYPKPREFTEVLRAWYFPDTDTMYLSGYTWDCPDTGKQYMWGTCGNEMICYDNWTKPGRTLRCRMPFPKDAHDIPAITIADKSNRAFVGEKGNTLFTYDTRSGKLLGIIEPDPMVGHVGWIDIQGGVRAFTRKNGEIIVLSEDSLVQKQLIYRVNQKQKPLPPPQKE